MKCRIEKYTSMTQWVLKLVNDSAGADAAEASTSGRAATTETAEKLDALMSLVLAHLEQRCEQGQLAGAWSTLLHAFERGILDTHRSKFTQYLLWYLCRQVSDTPLTSTLQQHPRARCHDFCSMGGQVMEHLGIVSDHELQNNRHSSAATARSPA